MAEEVDWPAVARAAIKRAEEAMLNKRLQLSQNQFQPRIAWTLVPWSEDALRAAIEAEGASPLRVLSICALPRTALTWAGAPMWAQYAYLLMTEVRAINV